MSFFFFDVVDDDDVDEVFAVGVAKLLKCSIQVAKQKVQSWGANGTPRGFQADIVKRPAWIKGTIDIDQSKLVHIAKRTETIVKRCPTAPGIYIFY